MHTCNAEYEATLNEVAVLINMYESLHDYIINICVLHFCYPVHCQNKQLSLSLISLSV